MLEKISNIKFQISNFKYGKGFTLIELVIVAGILTIIASFVLTTINPMAQFQKTNDGRRKSDLAQIQRALEAYYQDRGSYPGSNGGKLQIGTSGNSIILSFGDPWPPYMNALPKDPSDSKRYVYSSPSGSQSYYLYAALERNNDPQGCYLPSCVFSIGNVNCSANSTPLNCNYGVSSPNVNP